MARRPRPPHDDRRRDGGQRPPAARGARCARARVHLRSGVEAIRRGHPWVFRDREVARLRCHDGDVVEVHDARDGSFVARGLFDAGSPIAIRLFTWRGEEALDDALLERRIDEAVTLRERHVAPADTDCLRLVNGEGDLLPGLLVDRFGDHLVLMPACAFWTPRLPWLAARLLARSGARGATLRPRPRRAAERDGAEVVTLAGEAPPRDLLVRENGLLVRAFVGEQCKPGLFLDQRDNRAAVAARCTGRRVLNTFSYTGGFSLAAARAGARETVSIDLARHCAETARENFERNGLAGERHRFLAADVFDVLQDDALGSFDAVIVDPPSFATGTRGAFSTREGLPRLVALACGRAAGQALLVVSANTAQLSAEAVFGAVAAGTAEAGRTCRVLEARGLPADHPTLPGHPEGRYLKFLICALDG